MPLKFPNGPATYIVSSRVARERKATAVTVATAAIVAHVKHERTVIRHARPQRRDKLLLAVDLDQLVEIRRRLDGRFALARGQRLVTAI